MASRTALYLENTLGVETGSDQIVQQIGDSDFDTVIVAFLHPHSPWDLYYNNTQLYQNVGGVLTPCDPALLKEMAALFNQLKTGFPVQKKLLFSMGPFQSDYDNIAGDVETFVDNFITMSQTLPFDGIDFDYEGNQDQEHADLIAQIATLYAAKTGSPLITAAPYYGQDWWTGILQATTTATGNLFSWFNVQLYASGNPDPSRGATIFATWEGPIAAANANIADPSDFTVVGVSADPSHYPNYSPQTMQELMANIRASYPTMGGGFVWNYSFIESNVAAWGEAITETSTTTA